MGLLYSPGRAVDSHARGSLTWSPWQRVVLILWSEVADLGVLRC